MEWGTVHRETRETDKDRFSSPLPPSLPRAKPSISSRRNPRLLNSSTAASAAEVHMVSPLRKRLFFCESTIPKSLLLFSYASLPLPKLLAFLIIWGHSTAFLSACAMCSLVLNSGPFVSILEAFFKSVGFCFLDVCALPFLGVYGVWNKVWSLFACLIWGHGFFQLILSKIAGLGSYLLSFFYSFNFHLSGDSYMVAIAIVGFLLFCNMMFW